MRIELREVSKSYLEGGKKHNIFSDLTVKFTSGCFSVLLGKSGSGKSTLLNLIGGIDIPDSGNVYVGNENLSQMSDYNRTLFRRRKLGFIFQFFNLIPTLTVMENTLLIRELDGPVDKEQRDIARQILVEVGLEERMNAMPDNLSGGEQQRVAIARALAYDPPIILADEPTGNLDHETGRSVLEMMARLIREKGKTLIIATHSEEAIAFADDIYRIESGLIKPVSDLT